MVKALGVLSVAASMLVAMGSASDLTKGTMLVEKSLYPSKGELAQKTKFVQERMAEKKRMKQERVWDHAPQKSLKKAPQACTGGVVTIDGEDFPCNNVDFLSLISAEDLFVRRTGTSDNVKELADIWGYVTPQGREVAIVCMQNGVDFVDVTDPTNPNFFAWLPTPRPQSLWCDVKVYQHYAYVVKDDGPSGGNGIQVLDLDVLDGLIDSGAVKEELTADFVYNGHGFAHNLVMEEETGLMASVGAATCAGGLNVFDLSFEPVNLDKAFVGCIRDDGYVHDAECVIYHGPNKKFQGEIICAGFDATAVAIWQVKKINGKKGKLKTKMLSRFSYDTVGYVHQGWFSADHKYLIGDDELDEFFGIVDSTKTYVFDISKLKEPTLHAVYDSGIDSIDHNLYVWGSYYPGAGILDHYAYCANYLSGLRVLDLAGIENGSIVEAGFFDVAPEAETGSAFGGAWSSFMFPSGNLAVASIERGMFMLQPLMAFEEV